MTSLTQNATQLAIQRAVTNTPTAIVRHGTVTETDIGTFIHAVQLDADGVTVRVHDITHHGVSVGDRVTVLFAPPHQALIIGSPIHDPWHVVGTNGQVPFGTGWGNNAADANALDISGFPHTMFRREGRFVMVRGTAARASGSSIIIFTLPVGYRPRNNLMMPCATTAGAYSYVTITRDGEVAVPTLNTPLYFHNIHFTTS